MLKRYIIKWLIMLTFIIYMFVISVYADSNNNISLDLFEKNNLPIGVLNNIHSELYNEYINNCQNDDEDTYIPYPYYFKPTKFNSVSEKNFFSLPQKYDPRGRNMVTGVKNQRNVGVCWSMAAMSTLESFLIKNNISDNSVDLSEEHLLLWSMKQSDGYGWNKTTKNDGGQAITVAGYFSSWDGPKRSKDIPFKSTCYLKKPTNFNLAKTVYNVTDIVYLSNDEKSIKTAIINYGAVSSMYCHVNSYLSNDSKSYCYSPYKNISADACHEISIVGWDDNYSKYNFNGLYMPKRKGAWLVKNSWGEGFGDKGFMWISYEDPTLLNFDKENTNYAIKNATIPDNNKRIYQLNPYGAVSTISLKSFKKGRNELMTVANVFDFSESQRTIDSVMFMCDEIGQKYNIYYAPVEKNKPITNFSEMTFLTSGEVQHSGYTTVRVLRNGGVTVPKGKGSIVISFDNTKNNSPARVGSEEDIKYRKKDGSIVTEFKALGDFNQSYFISGNKCYDAKILNGGRALNFTIKVITRRTN